MIQREKRRPLLQVKHERELRGWSQAKLAEVLGSEGAGCDRRTVARWETGESFPGPYFRQRLCKLFGKNAEDLGIDPESAFEMPDEPDPPKLIFFNNMNLPAPCEFYGRGVEIETIFNRSSRTASTSIVGPRRIGKTWLMTYVKMKKQERLGSRFRLGYIDATMPDCATVGGFTRRAVEELGATLASDCAEPNLILFGEVLKKLKAQSQACILCIDEFEGLGDHQVFDLHFFTGLRALAQAGLGLIVASKRPLIDIIGDTGKTSGFFNIFEQLTLEPFTCEEAEVFAQEKSTQAQFSKQERMWLLHYGQRGEEQWPPLRLQLVGNMLLKDKGIFPKDEKYLQRFEQRLEDHYRAEGGK